MNVPELFIRRHPTTYSSRNKRTNKQALSLTDDIHGGAVETHAAVLLHHRQRHEFDVRVLATKGGQLLAQDVPGVEVALVAVVLVVVVVAALKRVV